LHDPGTFPEDDVELIHRLFHVARFANCERKRRDCSGRESANAGANTRDASAEAVHLPADTDQSLPDTLSAKPELMKNALAW
jgi:hypothetical protein